MVKNKKISIIVPCYNEEKYVMRCYTFLKSYLLEHKFDYEIVFVNDGSTDNTLKELWVIQKADTRVKVISYSKNKGKGLAVIVGLRYSKHIIKLILDCDLSVDIAELYKLNWAWIIKQNVIKGQRIQTVRQPLYRIMAGNCWKLLIGKATWLYMDTQCPFTILNLPQDFYEGLSVKGFAFDVEILVKAKKEGYKIQRVTVEYDNNPDSKVTLIKTLKMIGELREIKKKYFSKGK